MNTMTMNMSQGNIERDKSVSAEYADEIMYSGWNPVMTQLVPEDKHRSFPAELGAVDVELFLRKMYS